MRRHTFSLLAILTLAGTLTFAQQAPAPGASPAAPQAPAAQVDRTQPTPDSVPDVTLTGCLIQGSGPTVYILENAKTSTAMASDKGKSYVLTIAPSSTVNFRDQLNHQVRIVGLTDDKTAVIVTPPAGGAPSVSTTVVKVEEKDMPKFSTRTVTRIADTCAAAG